MYLSIADPGSYYRIYMDSRRLLAAAKQTNSYVYHWLFDY